MSAKTKQHHHHQLSNVLKRERRRRLIGRDHVDRTGGPYRCRTGTGTGTGTGTRGSYRCRMSAHHQTHNSQTILNNHLKKNLKKIKKKLKNLKTKTLHKTISKKKHQHHLSNMLNMFTKQYQTKQSQNNIKRVKEGVPPPPCWTGKRGGTDHG
jgi:hypothetical protein